MKNKKILIISIILIIIFLIINIIIKSLSPNNEYMIQSEIFNNSIDLIYEEKYAEAYELSQKIDNPEEKENIQEIIDYLFLKKTNNNVLDTMATIQNDILRTFDNYNFNITLYGYGSINSADKQILSEDLVKLESINKFSEQFPKNILSNDIEAYYDSFFKVVEYTKNLCDNPDEKMSTQKGFNELGNTIDSYVEESEKLTNLTNSLLISHSVEKIDDLYVLMFGLSPNNTMLD